MPELAFDNLTEVRRANGGPLKFDHVPEGLLPFEGWYDPGSLKPGERLLVNINTANDLPGGIKPEFAGVSVMAVDWPPTANSNERGSRVRPITPFMAVDLGNHHQMSRLLGILSSYDGTFFTGHGLFRSTYGHLHRAGVQLNNIIEHSVDTWRFAGQRLTLMPPDAEQRFGRILARDALYEATFAEKPKLRGADWLTAPTDSQPGQVVGGAWTKRFKADATRKANTRARTLAEKILIAEFNARVDTQLISSWFDTLHVIAPPTAREVLAEMVVLQSTDMEVLVGDRPQITLNDWNHGTSPDIDRGTPPDGLAR